MYTSPRRSDELWIAELRGDQGLEAQRQAHEDLSGYLIVVIYNYFRRREAYDSVLVHFAPQELTELAHDFAQDTLEKIARDDFVLLDKFYGDGAFTSWIAQVTHRIVATELRRPYWRRRVYPVVDGDEEDELTLFDSLEREEAGDPAEVVIQHEVAEMVRQCIEELSERYRTIFLRCIGDNEKAEVVAQEMDTSANAVYVVIYRAKRQLRKCLEGKGVDRG
ncbi:MAG: sigma-70 family RNA polymerase sigma factor [Chloroflexota bacterium]